MRNERGDFVVSVCLCADVRLWSFSSPPLLPPLILSPFSSAALVEVQICSWKSGPLFSPQHFG